jgi:protocatechuate 3,4-dioxygenase beta subunit
MSEKRSYQRKRISLFNRRRFLVAGAASITLPALTLAQQQCRVTPRDALGPFYVKGAPAQANLCASGTGGAQKLTVSGRVLGTPECAPLAGALVEVWQADNRGDYTQVTAGKTDDPGCLLRASLTTDAGGRYRCQTIIPGEYPGRPRHIHYRVSAKGCQEKIDIETADERRCTPIRKHPVDQSDSKALFDE